MTELSPGHTGARERIHLVFRQREEDTDQRLLQEISRYGMITGWDNTLEEAARWAERGGGEDPDLILIDSTVYFGGSEKPAKVKLKGFLRLLLAIQKWRLKSRIIILMSENMLWERELMINLLKMQLYNFWFLDAFDEADVRTFMLTERTMEEAEGYLALKEKELAPCHGVKKKSFFYGDGEKIFTPYHVQSKIITFWSENDTGLNFAMGILTALNLARQGFKVLLAEPVCPVPCLAGALAIEHPYFNTSHALSMYIQGNNDFIRHCFYNAEKYRQDPYGAHQEENSGFAHFLPPSLYFLPDGKREDNAAGAVLKEHWPAFITKLSRIVMFEQGFHFLIFLCAGRNAFNQVVLDDLTYTKFLTVDLLPSSVFFGLREREKGAGRTHVIGNRQVPKINQEIRTIDEQPFLYPPPALLDDFLQFVYQRDYRKITAETEAFVHSLMETVGVKVPVADFEKKSWSERLWALLKPEVV